MYTRFFIRNIVHKKPTCRIFKYQTFHHQSKFKKLSELTTLIDIKNKFFTRKIKKLNKKLLELKTCNFWLKNKKLLELRPSPRF